MPRGDRTGPRGYGSRTGRGLGFCNGYDSPGFTKGVGMGLGGGWGRGRGRGGGWGRNYPYEPYYPQPRAFPVYPNNPDPWPNRMSSTDEKVYLEQSITKMKEEILLIEKRLNELQDETE